jgi:hypothetical protein
MVCAENNEDYFNQGLVPIPHADKVEFQPANDFWTREVVEDRFPRNAASLRGLDMLEKREGR